ncbi:MAG: M13 family metallopeptidase [Hymenobacteraceae bacterium]|nr:M13 family metallopeptidase [Hymenobacteraceae bacterium]
MIRSFSAGSLLAALLFSACQSSPDRTAAAATAPDLLAAARDTTVAPGDDFFTYANGAWLQQHPIPASESSWGIGKEVQNEIYARLRRTSEEAAAAPAAPNSNQQKIGNFWAAGMDSVKADKLGTAPIKPYLARIAAMQSAADVPAVVAQLLPLGVQGLLSPAVEQDAKRSDRMVVYLYQGGLGLPNRDYYFNTDARTRNIRRQYERHVAVTLGLVGQDSGAARTSAARVVALETTLARASRKLEALRDSYANYNKMGFGQLRARAPGIDWQPWLTSMGIGKVDSVVVGQPEFIRAVGQALRTVPLADWQAYLTWHTAHTFASTLGRDLDAENFHFYGTVLNGATQQRPRWKRVLDMEEDALGEALGQLFVKAYFKPAAKARYEAMVTNVMHSFADHIQQLDWMSDTTKRVALAKLQKISRKVGYPDKWRDYSALLIDRSSLAANVRRANEWQWRYAAAKLGRPVDRTEWGMTPQTYNAYYNPSNNEIVLPAAIFAIPGLPDSLADDALVYGYGGASTIGHELTHGFDDEGSQFDAAGNLREWWTPADRRRFRQRVAGIVRQFDGYTVLDSIRLNGKATAGENIADLGGIVIAFDAFKKTAQYREGKKIGGLTPTQRYFLGYSLGWQSHQRDESLAARVLTDVHSPAQFRVNGPFADVPEFYGAFNVKASQKLYRPDSARVVIW